MWNGDLEKIKTLTLTSWDEAKQEPPLKISVFDEAFNTPFSLAFFKGKYDIAKAILEIAQAQYAPEEESKKQYMMDADDENQDDMSDAGSVDSSGSGPAIYHRIIDNKFTIEDIGQVSMQVNATFKPQQFLRMLCLGFDSDGKPTYRGTSFEHAICANDMKGLRFLLDIAEHYDYAGMVAEDNWYSMRAPFPQPELESAIQNGKTEAIAELIRRTGAGIPLENLVKDSGVEVQETHEFYQGLTVYGKKRYVCLFACLPAPSLFASCSC